MTSSSLYTLTTTHCEDLRCPRECTKVSGYMLSVCQGACLDQMTSEDLDIVCAEWIKRGDCIRNPQKMMVTCAPSCQDQNIPVHVDEDSMCKVRATEGCRNSPQYMLLNCEITCYNQAPPHHLRDLDPRCSKRVDRKSLCRDRGKAIGFFFCA